MKILILSLNHYIGGSETHAINLYSALKKYTKHNVRHIILTLSGKPKKGAFYKSYFEHFPMSPKSKRFENTIKEISKADVVQLSDMGHYDLDQQYFKKFRLDQVPPYFEILNCAGKLNPKQKVVGTFHSTLEYMSKNIYPYCEQLADCCDKVYAIRKNIAERLGCEYLPHMIEPISKKVFNNFLKYKSNKAVSTSRCISVKGQMYIVRASEKIKGDVIIYGMGNTRYAWQLKEEVKKLKLKKIILEGEFNPDNMHNILGYAKGLFNLTKIEGDKGGTEYTILEGINYGCLPIIDEKWKLPYFEAIRVQRNDPDDIAEGTNLIFKDDNNYKRDVIFNHKMLCKHFSAKKVIKQYEWFYRELFIKRKKKVFKKSQLPHVVKHVSEGGIKKTRLILPIDEFRRYYRKSKVITKIYNGSKILIKYWFGTDGRLIVDAWKGAKNAERKRHDRKRTK